MPFWRVDPPDNISLSTVRKLSFNSYLNDLEGMQKGREKKRSIHLHFYHFTVHAYPPLLIIKQGFLHEALYGSFAFIILGISSHLSIFVAPEATFTSWEWICWQDTNPFMIHRSHHCKANQPEEAHLIWFWNWLEHIWRVYDVRLFIYISMQICKRPAYDSTDNHWMRSYVISLNVKVNDVSQVLSSDLPWNEIRLSPSVSLVAISGEASRQRHGVE